jgi:parallel beta-helix repeat protein
VILQPTQQLNITNGTLFLGNGSDLTAGPITIGTQGKLAADSSQTITLGGNLINNGVVDLQGGGAGCPESDTILVRSSTPGTQRNWTGGGAFRIVDVDIQDQGGTAPVTVFSGTNAGNDGANFVFDSSCPVDLALSPLTTGIVTSQSKQFVASGGIGIRTFSIAVNNSGGTINSGNGFYTSGPIPDVTDTIRVTDALGFFAEATANVTGPAAKLGFIVQPTDSGAGASISPPIQVAVQDQAGVTVTTATNTVVMTISNNPGGGVLSGTATRAAVAGIVSFDNLSINKLGNGYTLRAGSNALTAKISGQFNITAGAPASLAFTVQPQDVNPGAVIAPPLQVTIFDGLGNVVSNATNPITIAIGNNPGSSTLSGTTTVDAVSGIATFADLSLDKSGNSYTLNATSPSLNGSASSAFNVLDPFQVANTNDSGSGSLRQAILNANSTAGTQTISFNLPGPFFRIQPLSNLPTITDPLIIDGTTQPGYAGVPIVEINGGTFFSGNPVGLRFTAGGNTVKALAVNGFNAQGGSGFSFEGSGSNTITANFVGVQVSALNDHIHNIQGIFLGSSNNRVTGNVITDDKIGIAFGGVSSQNVIAGNLIGTDPNGNATQSRLMNIGIFVDGPGNLIGGPNAEDRNVISGTTLFGVQITGDGNALQGNYIGTTANGITAFGNAIGVNLQSAHNNMVADNLISGNDQNGIRFESSGVPGLDSSDNIVQNNLIGLDASGTAVLPNGKSGIFVDDIGAADFNRNNRLTQNRIFGNLGLGIQLGNRVALCQMILKIRIPALMACKIIRF